MTKKIASANNQSKNGTVWAISALALWSGLIYATTRSLGEPHVSSHDLLIVLLATGVVVMGVAAFTLMRRSLSDFADAARTPAHRGRS